MKKVKRNDKSWKKNENMAEKKRKDGRKWTRIIEYKMSRIMEEWKKRIEEKSIKKRDCIMKKKSLKRKEDQREENIDENNNRMIKKIEWVKEKQ